MSKKFAKAVKALVQHKRMNAYELAKEAVVSVPTARNVCMSLQSVGLVTIERGTRPTVFVWKGADD